MENALNLSIVVYVDQVGERLERFFNTASKNDRVKSGEVIFVCPKDNEGAEQECRALAQQHDFVKCVSADSNGLARCFNAGLDTAKGDFIMFSFSSAVFFDGALDSVMRCADAQTQPALLRIKPFYLSGDGKRAIPYPFASTHSGSVDLRSCPRVVCLVPQAYVIPIKVARAIRFNEDNEFECQQEFLLRLLVREPVIYALNSAHITFECMKKPELFAFENAACFDGYIPSLQGFILPFLEQMIVQYGKIPLYIQQIVFHLICNKYSRNHFDRDTGALSRTQAFEFDDLCMQAMKYIDDCVIIGNIGAAYTAPHQLKMHFYRGKYGCRDTGANDRLPHQTIVKNGALMLEQRLTASGGRAEGRGTEEKPASGEQLLLGRLCEQKLTIQVIDCIAEKTEIDARFNDELLSCCDYQLCAMLVPADNDGGAGEIVDDNFEKIALEPTGVYSSKKYFGVGISRFYTVHLSIETKRLVGKKLLFAVCLDGVKYALGLEFSRAASRLSGSRASYWQFQRGICMRCCGRAIAVERVGAPKLFLFELRFLAAILFGDNGVGITDRIYCTLLRLLADITHPFYKKRRIWLAYDKLYKAGDNAEYIFRYCCKQEDDIDCYYIIKKDSVDYPRLKAEFGKKVLVHESVRQRLLALNSELILATHATIMRFCGFNNDIQPFFKDKFTPVVMCIQHGLTIQKIAQYQNRVYDGTRLYGLASKYEYANICNEIYGYTDRQLRMTGLARYDGLRSNDRRQLLITPTWRRNIVKPGIAFVKKSHSDGFRESEFFRLYNQLINDERLISTAKGRGYKIVFLLHPAISSQLCDFDKNDFVELLPATGNTNYEKLLTESSLMITDYSGVQFDFAYQRKPVVYYHPQSLPPQYETVKFDYDTMGFGPICKEQTALVDTLCEYMERDCENPTEYIRRADDFFEYSDFENCRRIYDAATAFFKDEAER